MTSAHWNQQSWVLKFRELLNIWKVIKYHEVLIQLLQKWYRQEKKLYVLRLIKLINFIWNKMNCLTNSVYCLLFHLLKRRVIKLNTVKIEAHICFSNTWKIAPNNFLSRLVRYIDETSGDHHCRDGSNRLNIDQKICTCQVLENSKHSWTAR
jgi:hypothetical protein